MDSNIIKGIWFITETKDLMFNVIQFQFIEDYISIRLVHNLVHNRSCFKLLETVKKKCLNTEIA